MWSVNQTTTASRTLYASRTIQRPYWNSPQHGAVTPAPDRPPKSASSLPGTPDHLKASPQHTPRSCLILSLQKRLVLPTWESEVLRQYRHRAVLGSNPCSGKRCISSPNRPKQLWGQPCLFTMGDEVRYRGQTGQGVKLSPHPQLVLRLRVTGVIPLLFTPTFVACTAVTSYSVTFPISFFTVMVFFPDNRMHTTSPAHHTTIAGNRPKMGSSLHCLLISTPNIPHPQLTSQLTNSFAAYSFTLSMKYGIQNAGERKGKGIPVRVWSDPEGSRRLILDLKKIRK